MGIAAILTSALMYAYNLILQRRQALVAQPVEIVVFQSGTLVFVYLLFAPWWAITPGSEQFPALGGAAAFSVTSILLLSWAYARAEARILKLGRLLATGDVSVFSDGIDEPVAHATVTYAIPPTRTG